MKTAHKWTRTLGPGPYRFIGSGKIHFSDTFGARYVGPDVEFGAGTCAHCGMAIINIYVVETGEGRRFGVGSDCIDALGLPAPELNKVEKAKAAHDRQVREARRVKKQAEAFAEASAFIDTNRAALAALPHPSSFYASTKSLLDYAGFCIRSGTSAPSIKNALAKLKLALEAK